MALQPRDPEDRISRRRPVKRGVSPVLIGALVVVILGGGAVVAVLSKKGLLQQPATAAETAKPKPFADLPPETPPPRRGGGAVPGRAFGLAAAPADLVEHPAWQEAIALAAQADVLYDQAVVAMKADDRETLNAMGNAAKKKYNEAAELTAVWEEELFAKYGEGDPQVREIKRERTRWFNRLDWLLKSTSR
jgi:hypothetical protein